jgi:hypothetical protein
MNSIKKIIKETDWIFFIFLLIFLNQSNFSLKTIGIAFIYIARPNLKFGFFKGRIPKFYLFIIVLAILNYFINIRDFSIPYFVAFSMACLLWVYSFLAYHQLKLSVERYGEKNINTLKIFTLLNLIVTVIQLTRIIIITGKLNPYRGLDFPYGLSTGDNLYGIFLQNSYYNVMTCAFLSVYFLYKRNFIFSLLAVITLILVFANTGTLIFIISLIMIFIMGIIAYFFRKNMQLPVLSNWIKNVSPPGKFYITIPIIFIVIGIFSYIISPENITYTVNSFVSKIHQGVSKQDKNKLYALQEKATQIKDKDIESDVDSTNSIDTNIQKHTSMQKYTNLIYEKEQLSIDYIHKYKGKKLSILETLQYLKSSPGAFLFGAGPVRFSSLTAQKMSGYDSSRIFKKILPRYSSRLYEENHKLLIKARAESTAEYWSSINWPDCFYNQILGEYGVLGALLFIIFYVWYFVKKIRYWSYGLWLSVLIIPFSFLSYMFEPFAVIIIFEFLMEMDMKNNIEKYNKIVEE